MDWTIVFCIGVLAGLGLACILPALMLRLHTQAFRLWWRWRSRRRGGRPPLDPELIALIRRMSLENPLWGAPRIHGELLKLGFQLAQSTVSKYMIARRGRPSQSWDTFLRNHAPEIAAVDLLTVWTALLDRIYAFVVLAHDRRAILHIQVADRPTAMWLATEIVNALASQQPQASLPRARQ